MDNDDGGISDDSINYYGTKISRRRKNKISNQQR